MDEHVRYQIEHRYLHDPLFHARVDLGILELEKGMKGSRFLGNERHLIFEAVAIGVTMAGWEGPMDTPTTVGNEDWPERDLLPPNLTGFHKTGYPHCCLFHVGWDAAMRVAVPMFVSHQWRDEYGAPS